MMTFLKGYIRWFWRLLLALIVILSSLIAGLYIFVQKGDVRSYMMQIVSPYAPHLKLEGPIRLGIWPSLHLDAQSVTHEAYKIERVRLQLPLIPLIRFALWRTPQKDLHLDVTGFSGPGVDAAQADVACESEGEIFKCKVQATMKAYSAQLQVDYAAQETQLKGDVHFENNTLHIVKGVLHNKTYEFKGQVTLIGRSPIVISTSQPIDVHYGNNTLNLKAPHVGLPYGDIKNVQLKLKHHDKTVDIMQLEADGWQGHISTTGSVTWPQVTLKGKAHNMVLTDIKELKPYLDQGIGSAYYHIAFNGENVMESLTGQTHIKLTPVVIKGIDLAHLRQAVQNLSQISLADIPQLKDKLVKPGLMTLTCDLPIAWTQGLGVMQWCRVEAKEIRADLSGQFNAKKANVKAVVEGLPNWPPLTVHIKGAWDQLSYEPDFADLVKKLMQQAVKNVTQNMKKSVQEGVKNVIQGNAQEPANIGQKLQQEAGKLLSGLLGKRS